MKVWEDKMSDTQKKDKEKKVPEPASKPVAKQEAAPAAKKPGARLGLIEILIFLLIAGVVFIFVFGMRQMRLEKAQEAALFAKFEKVLPHFEDIGEKAKILKQQDDFAEWPPSLEFIDDPDKFNTPEFTFEWLDDGRVEMTTTKEFGREGIVVTYDVEDDSYSIDDPDPTAKPTIKYTWVE